MRKILYRYYRNRTDNKKWKQEHWKFSYLLEIKNVLSCLFGLKILLIMTNTQKTYHLLMWFNDMHLKSKQCKFYYGSQLGGEEDGNVYFQGIPSKCGYNLGKICIVLHNLLQLDKGAI